MKIISRINTKIPCKIVVKSFSNVYTEANKNYITMTAASFGLNSLYLVIAEDITVPNGRIFSGFYNDGTTWKLEMLTVLLLTELLVLQHLLLARDFRKSLH